MGTVGDYYMTLSDWAARKDPDGKTAKIVEMLNKTNLILQDMGFVEGNLPTGHRTTIRAGIPEPTWRLLYGGTMPGKSQTVQVTDSIGQATNYLKVDKALADLNGDKAAFMLSESQPIMEGFNQAVASTIFYGDRASAPAKFHGLAPRYPSKTSPNVIDCAGTGSDCTSIWLVGWGPNSVHGIFPKGSKAGLSMQDQGQVTVTNSDGSQYEAYQAYFEWFVGLCVRDWRYVVRICNVDTGSMPTDSTIPYAMIEALNTIPSLEMGKLAFYMNRTVKTSLDKRAYDKSDTLFQINKAPDDPFGRSVTSFQGTPLRICDAILNTETALS